MKKTSSIVFSFSVPRHSKQSISFFVRKRQCFSNPALGFTLIELMVVVVIITVFAAIGIPSYQRYIERRDLAVAKQEAQRIATELERFKAKNFSYKGFDASYLYHDNTMEDDTKPIANSYYDAAKGELLLPVGSTSANAKYILTLLDAKEKRPLSAADLAQDKAQGTSASTVSGLHWVMKVERNVGSDHLPKQPNNYDLLLTSTGVRCMTRTQNAVDDYTGCGTTDSENW
ncbi:hypothetical protein GCM10023206_00810 [Acinetobacter puyangensis]|uniref:Type IV pilus assembly protein PilE n=1 Tax=Acinetobacter puyangensis TaxID=1096779 RepID=A0A240E8M6_9GAMM|nr:prepilin-type N-terminal cleavage/methylation domain-containing protein [Acinetobacter puyangensis]SNX44569.1 type IV pilus assembly protein PilE [Acinetobacter puyangensis]